MAFFILLRIEKANIGQTQYSMHLFQVENKGSAAHFTNDSTSSY